MGPPGHFGIAFAVKPLAPKAPLLVLLAASEALDLLSLSFIATGIEDVGVSSTNLKQGLEVLVPASVSWSHGLFMSIVWSIVFAVIAFLIWRDKRTSGIIGLVVFSHWVLDFIVHAPDLPIFFDGSTRLGLGLWTSGPGLIASIILELFLLAAGITIYMISRKRKTPLQPV
jgi:hypothetical protein